MGLLKTAGQAVYLNSARWRLPGLLSARETESGQVEGQVRERVLTYRSSGVRMTATPDPANCASCPENYYSMCPVQKTKGPCDRGRQQCPAQGGPGPAPIRPSLGHLLHHPQHTHSCQGPHPQSSSNRQEGWQVPALPARPTGSRRLSLLAQGSWPTLGEMLLSASAKVVMANMCGGEWGSSGGEAGAIWGQSQTPSPRHKGFTR